MQKTYLIEGFWERVEIACGKSGLSKSEIARRMGMDRINLYQCNHKTMSISTLAKFCAVTGVSSDYMLGLKDMDELMERTVVSENRRLEFELRQVKKEKDELVKCGEWVKTQKAKVVSE